MRADDIVVVHGRPAHHAVTLAIGGIVEEVVVRQEETARRLANHFTDTLSAEELDQLPDDPEAAAALILELAGLDAEMRIDGFEGGDLPGKSQIQAIRIRHDPFAADARGAGRPRVEIITKPGTDQWEHGVDAGIRDQSMDARNPLTSERGEGQTRRLRWRSSGPIVRNRTSLAFSLTTADAFDVEPIVARTPQGALHDTVNRENDRLNVKVRLDHTLTATQTLRAEYQRDHTARSNLGVGTFNLPDRAYDTTSGSHRVRLSTTGPLGRKALNEFRAEGIWRTNDWHSRSQEVTLDVADAFTTGGAQLAGATREREIGIADDLELVLSARHKIRMGFEGEFGRVNSNRTENTTGRFVFPSLEAYEAGEPIQFTQRIGDPRLAYSRYEFGWYVYDELRPRKNVQLGLGLRHDSQSFTNDWANFGPRASVAWSPTRLQGTTVRAGAGVFYDRYDASLHEQTLRLDGERQRELIVTDPGWPEPFEGEGGVRLPPPSVVRASEDLQLPTTRRVSFGFQQRLAGGIDLRVNVFRESMSNRLRSIDVNAPVDGVRANPQLARVTEIQSGGRAVERGFDVSVGVQSPRRGLAGSVRYRYARELNDADGALSLPVDSANLVADWGPASDDVRHRLFGRLLLPLTHGVRVGVSARASSGAPYTVLTGFDDNRDTVPNDRPAGIGRNTERGAWQALIDLRLGWILAGHDDAGGSRQPRAGLQRRLEIYGNVSNLFNRTNFTRYGGVLTSPYFGRPTAALPGRRIELGLRVSM